MAKITQEGTRTGPIEGPIVSEVELPTNKQSAAYTAEKLRKEIFANLYSLVDCSETEIGLATKEPDFKIHPPESGGEPFRRETNFGEDYLKESISIRILVGAIFLNLKNILYGQNIENSKIKNRLGTDKTTWNSIATDPDYSSLNNEMKKVFIKAFKLLDMRESDEKKARRLRVGFYIGLSVIVVGKLIQKQVRLFLVIGSITSLVLSILMSIHYGVTSFKQTRKVSILKRHLQSARKLLQLPEDRLHISCPDT